MELAKDLLQIMFINRDEEFWRIYTNEWGESKFKGIPIYNATSSTGYAAMLRYMLGDVIHIYGFDRVSNPTATMNDIVSGHDFAILNGEHRYIIDPWLVEVEQKRITTHTGDRIYVEGQGVFDLTEDKDLVKKIYNEPIYWKRMFKIEEFVDKLVRD